MAQGTVNGVAKPSGFLKDDALLEPVPGKEGPYAWTARDAGLKRFNRYPRPRWRSGSDKDADHRGLSAGVIPRLATSFTRVLGT